METGNVRKKSFPICSEICTHILLLAENTEKYVEKYLFNNNVCRRSPGGFTELVQLVIFVGIDIYGKLFDQTGEQICVVLIYFGWGTEPQPKYIRTTQITLASFLNENAPTIK